MEKTLDTAINEAWQEALDIWNSPSVPYVIAPQTEDEIKELKEIGMVLEKELAFMHYPDFQTYLNIKNIEKKFADDVERGLKAISKHEVGHRFCPYDIVTSIILKHDIKKELNGKKLPYSLDEVANTILNLFGDMTINTKLTRNGDEDMPWAYEQISKTVKRKRSPWSRLLKKEPQPSKLWKVYGKSMELAWQKKILPESTKLNENELKAAQELSDLFKENYFIKDNWRNNIKTYARVIHEFLEDENKDKSPVMSDIAGNIPGTIDDKTMQEIAKRLAEIGSNGLPTNPNGLKEFKEMMAGFGQGDPIKASISFYDRLSDSYDVMFATRPFGRPRANPFQPIKWTPSMSAEKLDVNYSVQVGGKIIPAVNTYAWNTRKRERQAGLEEIVPNLDLYVDSSMSMTNPVEQISLPVLAAFVVAKKAHRKGAYIRSTNFSGSRQSKTQESTRDINKIFENLVVYFKGGTDFPTNKLLDSPYPKQAIILTDAFLANAQQTAETITELRKRHKGNRVTIYALHPVDGADYLRNAGAEVIHGTTTDVFKKSIGKADEVYAK